MKPRRKNVPPARIITLAVMGALAASPLGAPLCAAAQETTPGPFTPRYPIHLTPPANAPASPPPGAAVHETAASPASAAPVSSTPSPAPTPVDSSSLPPAAASNAAPPSGATASNDEDKAAPRSSEVRRAPAGGAAPHRLADGKVVNASRMFRDYEVQKGDHLVAIARDFDTPADVLIEVNHLKSPDSLRPGQHLKVPVQKAYVVAAGDTITTVAKRFDLSPADLADLNNLPVKGRLRAGDKLALPTTFHDRGPIERPRFAVAEGEAPTPPARASRPRSVAAEEAGGAYVPSATALEAGARYRAESGSAATAAASEPVTPSARAPQTYVHPRAESAPSASEAQIAERGRGLFIWPVRGDVVTPFGSMGLNRRNDGVDLKAPQGTVVKAAAAGEVVYAGDQVPGFGNLVLVKHAGGWVTAYAHLDRASVQMRQMVAQGEELGQVGESGGVAEPELHFEIRYAAVPTDKARPVDPVLVLGGTPSS
jgi:murein DD-endopeptidase MepM/ murein hydrolase activator NlpD